MDWFNVSAGVLAFALVVVGIMAAVIRHLESLNKETRELAEVIREALADKQITKQELKDIFKETQDVAEIINQIVNLVQKQIK